MSEPGRKPFLGPEDLTPRGATDTPVAVATHMSATGWGLRRLTAQEIMLAWDLPAAVAEGAGGISDFEEDVFKSLEESCPIKMLNAIAEVVTEQGVEKGWIEDSAIKAVDPVKTQEGSVLPEGLDVLIGDVPIRDWVNEGCLAEKQFAKHDDSDPPMHIWDNRAFMCRPELVITQKLRTSTKALRGLVLRWCRRRVWRSFQSHLRRTCGRDWSSIRDSTHNRKRKRDDAGDPSNNRRAKALDRDLEAGRDVISRIADGDWWSWSCGSRLLFWKWQAEVTQDARDGAPFWVTGRLPRNQKPQRPPSDKRMAKFPAKKINKVRSRGYITPGFIRSLTNYFPVEKVVEDGEVLDVRMVCDATQSGLNDALWAPNFGLPTVRSHMRMTSFESEMADLDVGEMFLNFPLDPKMQPCAGVDLSPLAKDMGITLKQGEHLWERWNRLAMGMRPSPFMATRLFWLAEEIVRGDRRDPENYLRWNHIRMNLPGSKSYDPTLPWMCKIVVHNGCYLVAANFITFVDDIRSGGPGREWTWRATRQIAARLNSLGIQDAPRKRRPPSKRPDAWAGSMVEVTDENKVAN